MAHDNMTQPVSYKTVMIATDGSRHSMRALQHAVGIALAFDGQIVLVHVVGDDTSTAFELDDDGLVPQSLESRLAQGQRILDDAVKEVPEALRSSCQLHLKQGTPSSAILELSDETGADLLVLGGRGLSGFRRYLLGSVSYAVSRRSAKPVLIIQE